MLDARWKWLQTQVHPDRFVTHGDVAQRVAMQWTLRVNEAYQRLRVPLSRAVYLCELNGQSIGAESNTAMPAEFLMQQMAWREALDEARNLETVEALAGEVAERQRTLLDDLAIVMDELSDWPAAVVQIRALMFVFEDLSKLDPGGVQTLLRGVEKDKLGLALKGASDSLREMFFSNMSERAAKIMREDMESMGPVRLKDVDQAQVAMVQVAKDLAAKGEIMLAGGGDGDELIY